MSYTETLPKVRELINNLLIVLSDKERYIIESRFSLNDGPRMTLEKIGARYGVTRERVRQIEKNALKKLARNVNNTQLRDVTALALEILHENEGFVEEEAMINEILMRVEDPETIDANSLRLTIDLDRQIVRENNTIRFRPHWRLATVDKAIVKAICDLGSKELKGSSDVLSFGQIADLALKNLRLEVSPQKVKSLLSLDRRLKVMDGSVGLSSWRNINPKTLRDKIFYVFNQVKQPLHYVEISNRIAALGLDKKNVNVQAVHNELIRYSEFVLIGRGIYALKEWGYEQGTVADVIEAILAEHGKLTREQIVEKVMESRHVKRITILLNLKNKEQFARDADGYYYLEQ